jgi:hypothetical protein
MILTLPRVFALVAISSILGISSCSSKFDTNKPSNNGTAQLTPEQKRAQLASLAPQLEGEWFCAGNTGGINGCFAETVTFNSTLDHVTIENLWNHLMCRISTDYQLTIGAEDSDGITDFSVHTDAPGELIGPSSTNVDCKNYVATLNGNPLDENFSFSHKADWSQITIDESNFTKSPAPQPSLRPRAFPSSSTFLSPAVSTQLSNS